MAEAALQMFPVPECELDQALEQLEHLEAERDRLADELLLAKVRAGELEPPTVIEDALDARAWLAWAFSIGHQAGCLCHRCPKARTILSRSSE